MTNKMYFILISNQYLSHKAPIVSRIPIHERPSAVARALQAGCGVRAFRRSAPCSPTLRPNVRMIHAGELYGRNARCVPGRGVTIVTIKHKASLISFCEVPHRMTQFPDGNKMPICSAYPGYACCASSPPKRAIACCPRRTKVAHSSTHFSRS